MTKKEYITYVPKELVLNPATTGFDIMTYNICHIYGTNFFKEPIYITPAFIAGQLGDVLKYRTKATRSLYYLAEKYPQILCETKISKTFKLDITPKCTDSTVRIPLDEVDIILNSNYSYRFELLKLYYVIVASFKKDIYNFKGTNYGIGWYVTQMGVTSKTISTYLSSLKSLKMIYIYQDSKGSTNLIGRYQDKELLNEWAEVNGYIGGSRTTSNEARSLMMKYHRLEKGEHYPANEIKKIKAYIQYYNSIHSDKPKDLSVFDTIKY